MSHPTNDLLLHYVTGGLQAPFAVVIGSHLELCARCRDETLRLDSVGGNLLSGLDPVGAPDFGLAATLARLNEPPPPPPAPLPANQDAETVARLPAALRRYVKQPLGALPWRNVARGLSVVEFGTIERDGARVQLLRSRPGQTLPRHRHLGTELTLVLSGGLQVDQAHYERGAVLTAELGDVHQPVTEPGEDCLSFAVSDGPVRFTKLVPRLWQIMTGY